MNEHRINPRRRILKSGQIIVSNKAPKLEYTVRNLSKTGACLQISTTYGMPANFSLIIDGVHRPCGSVARLVGIEGGVVSGVFNLESSGVSASDWRPRHDEHYHEA